MLCARRTGCNSCVLDGNDRLDKDGRFDLLQTQHLPSPRLPPLSSPFHSFSECTAKSILWWLALLRNARVKYLFIVPNRNEHLLSTEADGKRMSGSDLLAQFGYRLRLKRPKCRCSCWPYSQPRTGVVNGLLGIISDRTPLARTT